MVYFLQDMRRDRIKIGYVDVMTVEARVHQIRLNHRGLIRLLATIEGDSTHTLKRGTSVS